MSPEEKPDAVAEDASVEQVHAAEPVHPDPPAGTPSAVPDPAEAGSPEELREQIEETRGELGDTVEALSHKLDVKGRAKDGIEERKQAAKDGVQHAKESLSETAAAAKAKVEDAAASAQAKATGAAQTAQERATDAAAAAQQTASGAAAGAQDTAGRAGQQVQENKVPVAAVAAVAGLLVVVVVWRRRSR